MQNVVHELRITNQVIYLNPPIEECRYKLYQEMFAWKMIVLSLPRIQSQRYQVSPRGRAAGPPPGLRAEPSVCLSDPRLGTRRGRRKKLW